jgi:signal transduction histidine kinase
MFATGIALLLHTRSWRQLAQAQIKFVANVSHEFRTPLTVIRAAAHNLKRGIVHENGQVEQYSKLIIEHADDLTEMVEQILALAGAQKRWPAASHQKLAPSEVLYEAVAATAQETKNADCAVHIELPPSLPPIVGEASALRRVFENLISNAAKHGGQGGWIGISGASHEDTVPPTVEIRVADRGRGIPPDEQAEIFHPFFRGASAQAEQVHGSGLGLSLVREIVEAHGGMVSVDSETGKGTTFTVRLPAISATEAL